LKNGLWAQETLVGWTVSGKLKEVPLTEELLNSSNDPWWRKSAELSTMEDRDDPSTLKWWEHRKCLTALGIEKEPVTLAPEERQAVTLHGTSVKPGTRLYREKNRVDAILQARDDPEYLKNRERAKNKLKFVNTLPDVIYLDSSPANTLFWSGMKD